MTRVVWRLRYLRRYSKTLAVAGSLSLHALGAVLILMRSPEGGPVVAEGAEAPGSVQVTLVPASEISAASSVTPTPTVDDFATPERPEVVRPVRVAGQALAPATDAVGDRGLRQPGGLTSQGLQTASVTSVMGADYRARLLAHIQPFRRYPAQVEAIAARGVTQLIFRVDQDGNVVGVWVKASSGFEALDNEAMATVLRAQPMPHVPAGLPSPLTVQLPVSFNPS